MKLVAGVGRRTVLVFGPLDAFFEPQGPGPVFLSIAISVGLCFVAFGTILEAWTRE